MDIKSLLQIAASSILGLTIGHALNLGPIFSGLLAGGISLSFSLINIMIESKK